MKALFKITIFTCIMTALLSGCIAPPPTAPVDTGTAIDEAATEPDTISSASPKESADPAALVNGLSENGFWIFSLLGDVTLTQPLSVDGVFHDKDDPSAKVYRKLALNTQDASYKVIESFTLTVPEMTINSPNFLIQNGTIKGNVYVNAEGLQLNNVIVDGNLSFETQALLDSAKLDTASVSGTITVATGADTVSSASPKESSDPAAVVNGLSANGFWIFSILSDVTLNDKLVVDGTFYDKDDTSAKVYRKLALYAQDADRNVTAEYTLTVPEMIVSSPNFKIQNGTVAGDIFVNADGFELAGATVTGNVIFDTQAQLDSAILDAGTVKGSVSVAVKEPELEPAVVPTTEQKATEAPAVKADPTPEPKATEKPAPVATEPPASPVEEEVDTTSAASDEDWE